MNLVIGNTSQLSKYFPDDYIKISSRNIDFNYLRNNSWDSVYITFAEQRIYDKNIDYITPNYINILQLIRILLPISLKIVCYTSCELWNNASGAIDTNTEPNFFPLNNEYVISKLLLLNKIKELRYLDKNYDKVVFVHPFYFNSVSRSKYFLFGKIFDSIINEKKIHVGSLDFYRDMVHAKYVVNTSIMAKKDSMAGSGKLVNVGEFIKDLYSINNLDFDRLVISDKSVEIRQKNIVAKTYIEYTYENLLNDTQDDIIRVKLNGNYR